MEEMQARKKPEPATNMREKFSAALLALACFLIHWAPVDLLLLGKKFPWPLSLIILAMVFSFRLLFPKRFPKLNQKLGYLYYLLVLIYGGILAFYLTLFAPMYVIVSCFVVLAFAALLYFFGEKRWPSFVMLAVMVIFLLRFPNGGFRGTTVVVALIAVPFLLLARPSKIGRTAMVFALGMSLLLVRFGIFYISGDLDLVSNVSSQEGIEAIAPLQKHSPPGMQPLTKQTRFAADGPNKKYTLIGTMNGTFALDNESLKVKKLIDGASADGMVYLPKRNLVALAGYSTETLYLFNKDTLAPIGQYLDKGFEFTNLWYDIENERIIAGDDGKRGIGIFDMKKGAYLPPLNAGANRDAKVDDETGNFLAATLFRLKWIASGSGEKIRSIFVPAVEIRTVIDAPRRHLYLTCFAAGKLWQIDLDTGDVLKKISLEPGIRFMEMTHQHDALYAAGYFQGNVYRVKIPEMEIAKKFFAGSRVRSLHIAPDSNDVVFGSSLGVFRYRHDSNSGQ